MKSVLFLFQSRRNAGFFHILFEIVDEPLHSLLARRFLSEVDCSAELFLTVNESYVNASLGQCCSCIHSARTAADYNSFVLTDDRLKISVTELVAGTRVDCALIWKSLRVEAEQ